MSLLNALLNCSFGSKVLLSSSVDIDFSLPPEPVSFRQVQPDVCPEAHHWRAAMDDEMNSMSRFQVYRRVPKSAATGRQILGCKWVFKRKTNKFGHVTRYRARLVAQGFRQKEFDFFTLMTFTALLFTKLHSVVS